MKENYLYKITILFGLSGFFLGFISYFTIIDHDLFHQMALFREVIRTGAFPEKDIFSYTSNFSQTIHHEWGAGAIHYMLLVRQGLGAPALLVLKYLLTALICAGVFTLARRRGASEYAFGFAAIWGIMLGCIGFTTIRAQLFSLLFLVIFILLIEEDRKGKKWPLLAWVFLFPLWVNLHAGFLIGLGLYTVYLLELFISHISHERDWFKALFHLKYQLTILVVMCLAVLLNPWGFKYIPALFHAVTLDRTAVIAEWRPVWQVCFTTFNILLISLIILIYAGYRQNKFWLLPGAFLVVIAAWQALWHYRHLSIYAVVFACYVPGWLENTDLARLLKRIKKPAALFFLTIGLVGVNLAYANKFWQAQIPTSLDDQEKGKKIYPVGAVKYLKDIQFSGNIMVSFNDGSYVSWNLFPKVKVSMDSRFEVAYSIDQVKENLNFFKAKEGWQKTLARYPTEAILLSRSDPLEKILAENNSEVSSSWKRTYIDDTYAVYLRADLAKNYPSLDRRGQSISATFP
jgi:hypothetical protein